MRRILVFALCALSACAPAGGDDAEQSSVLAGGPPVQMQQDSTNEGGTLYLARGDTAVVTVRFQRAGRTLLNEVMGGPGDERVAYTADLNRNGTVSRLQARIFARRGDTEPAGRLELVLRGDSMEMMALQAGDTVRDTVGIEAGSIPIPVAEDLAMVEQILRRARARGRPVVHLPIVTLEGGARSGTATVEFMGRDSARITIRVRDQPGTGQPARTAAPTGTADSAGTTGAATPSTPPPTRDAPATTVAADTGGAAADSASTTEIFAATDSVGRLLGGRITGRPVQIRREQ